MNTAATNAAPAESTLNDLLATLFGEPTEAATGLIEELRQSAAQSAACLMMKKLVGDLTAIKEAIPVGSPIAVEVRCIDRSTAPLRDDIQQMIAGAYVDETVESNVIVLFASSSNRGNGLRKLAAEVSEQEGKPVLLYTMFQVNGEDNPCVLNPGYPSPARRVIKELAFAKALPFTDAIDVYCVGIINAASIDADALKAMVQRNAGHFSEDGVLPVFRKEADALEFIKEFTGLGGAALEPTARRVPRPTRAEADPETVFVRLTAGDNKQVVAIAATVTMAEILEYAKTQFGPGVSVEIVETLGEGEVPDGELRVVRV